ncbi:MAG: bifunctional DNA-formamidopyrimidine glycosylase/DNA-(apurinic or apyrimidinic site) lyase [Rhodospirillales bacterium]|nr:bifunctional DNA-formamidopyrimidine glycosylase/DNA-(apurinic or apyrimidinic site) lyase [Rhodospirillales bacterium]MCB9996308.1 bifunctional DNA-formamidopyrimidine glycosylase/DNA-(apurinic or apyrimidinic site) lyase [Rhodospirillales bacterium]
MPELPEVETVCRGMEKALKDRVVDSVILRRAGLRVPFPADLKQSLEGHRALHFGRRAKYILIRFDHGKVVILHLGMSGRVNLIAPGQDYDVQKHDHLLFGFDDGSRMAFNDARRFGMVMLSDEQDLDAHPSFAGLGPEPLDNAFSSPVLSAALAGKKTPVKIALLDQRVVAGLGNIYVSEALFMAGILPQRPAGSLSEIECETLVQAIRTVLDKAIAAGGSTLKDYRRADGELGYFQHQFSVYDRAGKACPGCSCNVSRTGGIEKITQGGRSTYFCARKQK